MLDDKLFQKKIGWTPHETQKEVLEAKAREIVICAGRRWGKSALCGYIVARRFLQGLDDIESGKRDSIKIWIVSPTYDLSRKVFNYVIKFLLAFNKEAFIANIKERPNPQITLSNDIWIQCKSADEPNSLLGEGLDLLIVDEAAQVSKTIWFDKLLPTTAEKSRNCQTIFISTPVGKNWFYDLYVENKESGGSFHFTSLDGIEIDQEQWERLKTKSPTDWFQQNYEATFLEKASAVFRGVKEANLPGELGDGPPYELEKPRTNGKYVGGLDLAQIKDFTVLRIFDYFTHKEVYFDRFHRISYPLQIQRLEAAAKKYGAEIIVELNNIGLAVSDELKARGVRVQDFHTTGSISKDPNKRGTKEEIINKLAVDLENKNIKIAAVEVSNDELESYTHILTPSGNINFGAPEGGHDDCVMALTLANWGLLGKQRQQDVDVAQSMPPKKKKFQYD